jgi:hypothetical protein
VYLGAPYAFFNKVLLTYIYKKKTTTGVPTAKETSFIQLWRLTHPYR